MEVKKHQTILLVEDEHLFALPQKRILEKSGYEVLLSETGEEALSLVRENDSIDLVLMDIELGPGMDGIQAAGELLKYRTLPVVFLTAYKDEDTLKRVESVSCYGYILKTAGRYVLLQTIRRAAELFESVQEKERQEELLQKAWDHLQKKTIDLEEANIALKVLLGHIREEQDKQHHSLYQQAATLVTPFIDRLRVLVEDEQAEKLVEAIQLNLETILNAGPHATEWYMQSLSPKEQQVAVLVKEGRSNKEIAEILGVSSHTVAFHRKNIREKLDLRGEKKNLTAYLRSMYAPKDR